MTDAESQAHEFVRMKEWNKALELYNNLLSCGSDFNKHTSKERVVACLLGRSECCLELGQHEAVVADCRRIIKLLADGNKNNNGVCARKRLVHALFSLRRFNEAELATREWLLSNDGTAVHPEAVKTLEKLCSILQVANGQKGGNVNMLQQRLDEELIALESRFEALTTCFDRKDYNRYNRRTSLHDDDYKTNSNSYQQHLSIISNSDMYSDSNCELNAIVICSYCCLNFLNKSELRMHCQSASHQTVIMSDEGRDWRWRPPPRGFKADTYTLCESYLDNGICRYGAQCIEAHGSEELTEWRERFGYRQMRLQRACEKELYGKSYTEQLLERWIQASSPEKILKEKLEDVEDSCSADLVTTVSSKLSKRDWIFVLKTKRQLRAVALLQDAHRNHFFLKQIIPGVVSMKKKNKKPCEADLISDQEWNSNQDIKSDSSDNCTVLEHRVKVLFSTDIYGTFRQSVVFDFGTEPVLVKHLCVDVIPVTDADKIKEIRRDITLSLTERWNSDNSEIVMFTSTVIPMASANCKDNERERDLVNAYPSPRADTFTLTHSTITEKKLTKNNYRARMHELLCVEEMARYEQVARYNLIAKIHIIHSYLLAPNGVATSTAKYSHSGELFGLINLGKDVSEDTSAGRLILNNCTNVLISADLSKHKMDIKDNKRKVYEALIEDKGKNMIYLRLSATTVTELNLKSDTDFSAEIQFQLNRIQYCEWHYAIDKIADFRVIFPDTYLEPNIPWTPQRQWADMLDSKLNLKQKEAVVAITTPMAVPLPPILIIGPFGTGKTYTLAQAIKQLLLQSDTKILICTHSNSAADLYIKDYLHPYVESGHEEARPLRIYYHKRWVSTVNQVVQKYCLIETNGGVRNFRVPTLDDIFRHRIVVVTLSISMYLSTMGLPTGHFSHILLDEAAQAMECEAIMPLALANDHTRIVLAGDHMQLSPELFSEFAKERNLHVSLLERLYDHYPSSFPCKILLCENYRAHEAIIHFTSELFYDQKLISSSKQPRHEKFYPLTFFTTRGEDVQDQNSTAFYNNSEVYEVVERVCELRKKWPPTWGRMDDQSIGIMTPYADQVFRIRSELRKRRMGGISVERVLNVQGKQFRAIFLSTVRTRRTCSELKSSGDEMDFGFLSNSKLLNTAITRAQSLVAVVGDPVALCSTGRCRKVWERFIDICNRNDSLFGITWSFLRSQLDGVELKKTYVLNPLAPEFVPRRFQPETYIKLPIVAHNNLDRLPNIVAPQNQTVATSNNIRFLPGNVPTNVVPHPFVQPQAPVFTLPLYCYPPNQPTPNQTQMFPIRPPSGPLQFNPNYPLNSWPVNYPPVSPPVPNAIVTDRSQKLTPQRKPNEFYNNGVNVNNRVLGIPSQFQSTEEILYSNTVTKNNGFVSVQNALIPNQKSNMSSPTGFIHDACNATENVSYIKSPQFSGPNFQQPINTTSFVPISNKIIEPIQLPRRLTEKDQIQFLNNVHFPERHANVPQLQNSVSVDPSNLLPPNVSLFEMLSQSQSLQMEWYRHLIDKAGIESANKFIELLSHAKKQRDQYFQPDLGRVDDLLGERSLNGISMMHAYQNVQPIVNTIQQNNFELHARWTIEQKFIQEPNNKPMMLRDVEAPLMLQNISVENARNYLPVDPSNTDLMRTATCQNRPLHSVPLYRRQGQISNQHENQAETGNVMERPPSERSQSSSSGAFAGYAHATMNLQQPDRQTIFNGYVHQQINQKYLQQQINAEFSREPGSVEDLLSRQQVAATYASVLRASVNSKMIHETDKTEESYQIYKNLAQKPMMQNSNVGLYQYFS